jgi:tetratricopeptide (TPR) repeat protein
MNLIRIITIICISLLSSCNLGVKEQGYDDYLISVEDAKWFKTSKAIRLNEQALSKIANQEFEEAFSILKEAIKLEPQNPVLHNNLGLAYKEIGEYGKAMHFCQVAFKFSGMTYFTAASNLAYLQLSAGEYGAAIELCEYVEKHTENEDILKACFLNTSWANLGRGNCQRARLAMDKLEHVMEKGDDVYLEELIKLRKAFRKCDGTNHEVQYIPNGKYQIQRVEMNDPDGKLSKAEALLIEKQFTNGHFEFQENQKFKTDIQWEDLSKYDLRWSYENDRVFIEEVSERPNGHFFAILYSERDSQYVFKMTGIPAILYAQRFD